MNHMPSLSSQSRSPTSKKQAASVEFRNVTKRYGSVTAVDSVSFTIEPGQLVTLLGPSGCGKTTTLRMIAGLEMASEGQILIGGRDVTHLSAADRDVSMVFQSYALFPHMSVLENVAYGPLVQGIAKKEAYEMAMEKLDIIGLKGMEKRAPSELSGGQQQRVAVARALVLEPQVLLFDEPLSNLDAKLRAQTRLEIQKLHAELGVTSLFVTHDQVEAMTLAERMLVMNAGRVEQIGTPEEVYHRPATTFVASFIGSPPMNLMQGRTDGVRFTGVDGTALQLRQPAPREGELIFGWRPEHATMVQADQAHGSLLVELVEMLGAERLVHGLLAGQSCTLRIDGSLPSPRPGDRLGLAWTAEQVRWFDPATQARIA